MEQRKQNNRPLEQPSPRYNPAGTSGSDMEVPDAAQGSSNRQGDVNDPADEMDEPGDETDEEQEGSFRK